MAGTFSKITKRLMGERPARVYEQGEAPRSTDRNDLRTKIGYLSSVELLRDLPPEQMEEIDRATVMQKCKPGRVFYTPGETGEVLFILKKGRVQLYRMSPEGRKLVISELSQYSFFGEMSCIGQGMYDAFAEAVEESLICTMSRSDVERLLLSRPSVAVRILEAVGQRMVEAERRLEELAFKGLIPRLATLLLREAEGNTVSGLTHQDMADRLGVYRETVTTALNELKTAGAIEIGRKRIRITDRVRLERAARE